MIECVFVSVGIVFGILGIRAIFRATYRAIYIDRVARGYYEMEKSSAKQWEEYWRGRGDTIDLLTAQINRLKDELDQKKSRTRKGIKP